MQNEECTTVPPTLPSKITRSRAGRRRILPVDAIARHCTGHRQARATCLLVPALTVGLALGAAGCASPLAPQDDHADDLQFCADEVNRLRATAARPALRRAADLEAFAQMAAQHDSAIRVPHFHFNATNGGGVSTAETEILWWRGFSVRRVIELGLAQMWAVGPGGEHYEILAGNYSEIGCGIAVVDSAVTVAQEFR